MESKEVIKALNNTFKEHGYIKAPKDSWVLQTSETFIVFKIRTSAWSKIFYIDLGVIFKGLSQNQDMKTMKIEDVHVGHSLYNLFLEFGESQEYLERLFSFDLSEAETLNNIGTIFGLLKSKAMPYLEKFNDYKFLAENFLDKIAFKPFFVYFDAPDYYVNFFKKQTKE
jgi:hypothetical protein